MKAATRFCRLAGLAALVALAGCASQPFAPVSDPSGPVEGPGFSVLPPGGSNWVLGRDPSGELVVFGKADRERVRQGASFVASAMRARARHADIGSAEGLRAEVDASIRETSGRIRLIESKTRAYADSSMGTDCVDFDTRMEERDNPGMPGKVLLMTSYGKACRFPSAADRYVVLTCSERRPVDSAPMLDEALRAECARMVDSLRFLPAR